MSHSLIFRAVSMTTLTWPLALLLHSPHPSLTVATTVNNPSIQHEHAVEHDCAEMAVLTLFLMSNLA